MTLPLSQGKVAQIDDCDADLVAGRRWQAFGPFARLNIPQEAIP